jgi:hypothetical protein
LCVSADPIKAASAREEKGNKVLVKESQIDIAPNPQKKRKKRTTWQKMGTVAKGGGEREEREGRSG